MCSGETRCSRMVGRMRGGAGVCGGNPPGMCGRTQCVVG